MSYFCMVLRSPKRACRAKPTVRPYASSVSPSLGLSSEPIRVSAMQAGEYGAWSFVWLHSAAFHRKGGAPNDNEIFSKEARILYQGAIMWGSETRRNGKVLLLSGAPISTLLASDQCDGRRKGKIDAIVHVDSVVVGKPLKKLARGIYMAESRRKTPTRVRSIVRQVYTLRV